MASPRMNAGRPISSGKRAANEPPGCSAAEGRIFDVPALHYLMLSAHRHISMYQVVGGLIQINAQLAEMYRMSVEVWNKQSDYWRHNLITAGHTLGFNKTDARSSRLFRPSGDCISWQGRPPPRRCSDHSCHGSFPCCHTRIGVPDLTVRNAESCSSSASRWRCSARCPLIIAGPSRDHRLRRRWQPIRRDQRRRLGGLFGS